MMPVSSLPPVDNRVYGFIAFLMGLTKYQQSQGRRVVLAQVWGYSKHLSRHPVVLPCRSWLREVQRVKATGRVLRKWWPGYAMQRLQWVEKYLNPKSISYASYPLKSYLNDGTPQWMGCLPCLSPPWLGVRTFYWCSAHTLPAPQDIKMHWIFRCITVYGLTPS